MILPGTSAWRRRAALGVLALGVLLGARAVGRDLPHDQTFVFRLDETLRHTPLRLRASVTRIGETEACAGMSITRDGSETRDPRQTWSLPNGDYVVTLDFEVGAGGIDAGPYKEGETTRVERVSLAGGEIVVPFSKRVRE